MLTENQLKRLAEIYKDQMIIGYLDSDQNEVVYISSWEEFCELFEMKNH